LLFLLLVVVVIVGVVVASKVSPPGPKAVPPAPPAALDFQEYSLAGVPAALPAAKGAKRKLNPGAEEEADYEEEQEPEEHDDMEICAETGAGSGSADGPAARGPNRTVENEDEAFPVPPGCSIGLVPARANQAPGWQGKLPAGEKWDVPGKGKRQATFMLSFLAGTRGQPFDKEVLDAISLEDVLKSNKSSGHNVSLTSAEARAGVHKWLQGWSDSA
jgi:hypothetical protein